MKVEFLKKFSKDLDAVKAKSVRQSVLHLIELMETADVLDKIPNTKKLKGHRSAYRTRIGDYRAGFFLKIQPFYLPVFCIEKTSTNSFRKLLPIT